MSKEDPRESEIRIQCRISVAWARVVEQAESSNRNKGYLGGMTLSSEKQGFP